MPRELSGASEKRKNTGHSKLHKQQPSFIFGFQMAFKKALLLHFGLLMAQYSSKGKLWISSHEDEHLNGILKTYYSTKTSVERLVLLLLVSRSG